MKLKCCGIEERTFLASARGLSFSYICPHCKARWEIGWVGAFLLGLAVLWAFVWGFFNNQLMLVVFPSYQPAFTRAERLSNNLYYSFWDTLGFALMFIGPIVLFLVLVGKFGFRLVQPGHNKPSEPTR